MCSAFFTCRKPSTKPLYLRGGRRFWGGGVGASSAVLEVVLPVGVRALVFGFFVRGEADGDLGFVALQRDLRMMLGGGVGFVSVGEAAVLHVGVDTVERFRACCRSLEYADNDIILWCWRRW